MRELISKKVNALPAMVTSRVVDRGAPRGIAPIGPRPLSFQCGFGAAADNAAGLNLGREVIGPGGPWHSAGCRLLPRRPQLDARPPFGIGDLADPPGRRVADARR